MVEKIQTHDSRFLRGLLALSIGACLGSAGCGSGTTAASPRQSNGDPGELAGANAPSGEGSAFAGETPAPVGETPAEQPGEAEVEAPGEEDTRQVFTDEEDPQVDTYLMATATSAFPCDLSAPASAPSAMSAGAHPNILLNAAEIAAIKTRVSAGAEPWKSAYAKMIAAANAAKSQAPLSVRTVGNTGADYFTQNAYCGWGTTNSPCGADCCDGRNNPSADRGDYTAAIAISQAVRNLGLGYAFTGDASYAEQAVKLLRHWAVNSATAMSPKFTNVPSEIELAITIPGMFYGADLIWSYPKWTDRDAFLRWAAAFAADVRNKGAATNAQNFGDWRLVFLGMAASLTGDSGLLKYTFDHYKALVPNQINAAGVLVREIDRTKALFYSLYAVDAMSQVCEIGRHHGVDLYHFSTADGRGSIERAYDWLAPYVLNPATWPYQQISAITAKDSIATYELGYFTFGKPAYLSVLQKYGRPIDETRTAGPVSLTNARGALPWQLGNPSSGATTTSVAVITANRRYGPAPLSVTFDAGSSLVAGAAADGFRWDFGDGGSSTERAPVHSFQSPGCYPVTLTVSRGSDTQSSVLNVRADSAAAAGAVSAVVDASWECSQVAAQRSRFLATFALTPSASNMNGGVGFSSGSADAYQELAVNVRFNPEGQLDVRSGSQYLASATMKYTAGQTYQVRMDVDVAAHRYSVFVTPPGGAEVALARNYLFRWEQTSVSALDHLSSFEKVGSLRVENLKLTAP